LAEHYGDARDWLQGDQWDTVMNYDAFMEPITWFFTGMEKHSDEYCEGLLGNHETFIGAMSHHMASFMAPSLQVSMNELSNHDHSRFLTRTNHKVGRVAFLGHAAASEDVDVDVMREAVLMQMTWPGAPTLYYGDEAGVCGFTDPDNRRTYPWGQEDHDLIRFYKKMIAIHRKYRILQNGSVKYLWNDYQELYYGRFSHTEEIIVAINNRDEGREAVLEIWGAGITRLEESILTRIMLSTQEGYTDEPEYLTAKAGSVCLYMP